MHAPRPATLRRLGAAMALLLFAAGCETIGLTSKPGPACPEVMALRDAGSLVRYREGPGRDLTDVVFEAKVAGFSGECDYAKDRSQVTLDLGVAFEVRRGPANEGRTATFEYFVAVPAFHPAPQGKQTFTATVEFKGNTSRTRTGDRLKLVIPMEKGKTGEDYPVYVGFQLSEEELRDNRKLLPR